jgi:hypothetical protein
VSGRPDAFQALDEELARPSRFNHADAAIRDVEATMIAATTLAAALARIGTV